MKDSLKKELNNMKGSEIPGCFLGDIFNETNKLLQKNKNILTECIDRLEILLSYRLLSDLFVKELKDIIQQLNNIRKQDSYCDV